MDAQQINQPEEVAQIKALMIENGIQSILAEYSGEGDSGDIDGITAHEKTDSGLAEKKLTPQQYQTVADLCWDLIGRFHGGFENNDGGRGEIHFCIGDACDEEENSTFSEMELDDPENALRVSWEHRDYYIESSCSSHLFAV